MPAGLESTVFLGTNSTFCHVCVCSHGGEMYFSTWIMVGPRGPLQRIAFLSSLSLHPCLVEHHLGTRGQSARFQFLVPITPGREVGQVTSPFGPSAFPSKRWPLGPHPALPFADIHWKVLLDFRSTVCLGDLGCEVFSFEDRLIYWASLTEKHYRKSKDGSSVFFPKCDA